MSNGSARPTRMMLEPEAAELLAAAGIPYVDHGVARSSDEAVEIAARLGYPVVLKIVSADVVHKTEAGGVALGVHDEQSLRGSWDDLMARVVARCPSARLDGVLVARQISVRREMIVGALRDPTFGPTVMVGLGGVLAEALDDVAFRLAPLRSGDGLDMLEELRAAAVLDEFRGEDAVDRDTLAAMLVALGDLMLEHSEINEIDLNPVAVSGDGCLALDARVIVAEPGGHRDTTLR